MERRGRHRKPTGGRIAGEENWMTVRDQKSYRTRRRSAPHRKGRRIKREPKRLGYAALLRAAEGPLPASRASTPLRGGRRNPRPARKLNSMLKHSATPHPQIATLTLAFLLTGLFGCSKGSAGEQAAAPKAPATPPATATAAPAATATGTPPATAPAAPGAPAA